ncbi:MAG: GDYXXLXY domain-containing protein [Spirulina sp. SIO3F2]|nr:GDYXXLXY domain-containing protein [Spirulina sp. SIO3F2]
MGWARRPRPYRQSPTPYTLYPFLQLMKPLPLWRFGLPLLLQTLIILAVPAQAMLTYFTGRTVILQTAPVDPYDLLRGYSQTLNYDVSTLNALEKLPGWDNLSFEERSDGSQPQFGLVIYVVLEHPPADSESEGEIPQAWEPVRVSATMPKDLAANQITLRGIVNYSWVEYGLERYYMPEDQRDRINDEIQAIQQEFGDEPPFVVEVRVRPNGHAVPVSLWVGDRNYRF